MKLFFLLIVLGLGLMSCSNVKPWEKQAFANENMGFSAQPTYETYIEHVYFSKEAHQGGYGSSGGGCGCN